MNVRFWDAGQVQVAMLAFILFAQDSVFGATQLVNCTQMISVPTVRDIVPAGQLQTRGDTSSMLFMQDKHCESDVQLKHPLILVEQITQDSEPLRLVT